MITNELIDKVIKKVLKEHLDKDYLMPFYKSITQKGKTKYLGNLRYNDYENAVMFAEWFFDKDDDLYDERKVKNSPFLKKIESI